MKRKEAQQLIARYNRGEASDHERALVENWYYQQSLGQPLTEEEIQFGHLKEEIWQNTRLRAGLGTHTVPRQKQLRYRVSLWAIRAAAASILLVLALGIYSYWEQRAEGNKEQGLAAAEILPGGNRAVLTLSDGTTVDLSEAQTGIIVGDDDITYSDGTEVLESGIKSQVAPERTESPDSYQPAGRHGVLALNSISTPKGGTYQIILPDGTRVWLNASSTLEYPNRFSGATRTVELTGEAYFEIAHNQHKPFYVAANGTRVKVLGTHFNVMAYADEAFVETTLLEGSVSVSTGNVNRIIKPGEQAQTARESMNVVKANLEKAVAWKNGYFYFKDTDLKTVMRQISRWYNVDVEYRGDVPTTVFSGKMYKNVHASKVLDILSYFKVNFKIEEPLNQSGRKTIVIL